MLRVSIVLPFFGACDAFERTLGSVLEHRPDGAEVLVVLGGPYADPFGLAGEVEFLQAESLTSRIDLMNLGALHARAATLSFVSGPLEVEDGWCEAALPHFERADVASVAPVTLDAANRDSIVSAGLKYHASGLAGDYACGMSYDRRAFRSKAFVGPTLAAGFYRRSAFLQLGGFSSRWGDGLADLDFAIRAGERGWLSALEPACRAYAFGSLRPKTSAWSEGRLAEEFFWERQATAPSAWARLRHRALLAQECLAGFRRPAKWIAAMGRMTAKRATAEVPAGSALTTTTTTKAATRSEAPKAKAGRSSRSIVRQDAAHLPGVPGPLAPRSRNERIQLALRRAERRSA